MLIVQVASILNNLFGAYVPLRTAVKANSLAIAGNVRISRAKNKRNMLMTRNMAIMEQELHNVRNGQGYTQKIGISPCGRLESQQ